MTIEEINEKIKHVSFCHCFEEKNKVYVEFSDRHEGDWFATYDVKKGELTLGYNWGDIDDDWKREILETCNGIKPIKKCIHDGKIYYFVQCGIVGLTEWEIIKADEKAINETVRLQKMTIEKIETRIAKVEKIKAFLEKGRDE